MRHRWSPLVPVVAALSCFLAVASDTLAQQPSVSIATGGYAGEVVVPLNKSKVIELDRAFDSASVANPEIADIVPLSSRSVYAFGKRLGGTSLTLTAPEGQVLAVVDLAVTYDTDRLKRHLHQMFPHERVAIRPAETGIVLDGQVSNASRLADILAVAERYAPDAVTNLLAVTENQQVMLHVRFAELERQAAKRIGLNFGASYLESDGDGFDFSQGATGNAAGAPGGAASAGFFASAAFQLFSNDWVLDGLIDLIEEKGVGRLLAEPNLITRSGDTASFLAGGEFPVPSGADSDDGGTEISVEFKEFGIGLSFTPTVIGDDLINLELFTEVSDIDQTNAVRSNGIDIPALTVRRANTTVEMRSGQSFAIAGLLSDEFRDNVDQIPGAGDVPVLGSLFRSSGFESNQTELVIIVTPHLVRPSTPDALKTPIENYLPPSELDLFFLGRVSGRPEATGAAADLGAAAAGGVAGPHGYIMR